MIETRNLSFTIAWHWEISLRLLLQCFVNYPTTFQLPEGIKFSECIYNARRELSIAFAVVIELSTVVSSSPRLSRTTLWYNLDLILIRYSNSPAVVSVLFRGTCRDGSEILRQGSCSIGSVPVGYDGNDSWSGQRRDVQARFADALSPGSGRSAPSCSVCELLSCRPDRGQKLSVRSAQIWNLSEANDWERAAAPKEVQAYQPRRFQMRWWVPMDSFKIQHCWSPMQTCDIHEKLELVRCTLVLLHMSRRWSRLWVLAQTTVVHNVSDTNPSSFWIFDSWRS